MRLRGCMAVGINEIEADVRDLTDLQCDVLRIAENVHRTDLSDAEKGNQVYRLWGLHDEFETIKQVAERLDVPYDTIKNNWLPKSRKLSDKVREGIASNTLSDRVAQSLIKYPHRVQDLLADVICRKGLPF